MHYDQNMAKLYVQNENQRACGEEMRNKERGIIHLRGEYDYLAG
jgi:hypothetical protein